MEPPSGLLASLLNFICFLPYFFGLLILGFIKGIILCPLICVIMTMGNSAIIVGLWPLHFFWTLYCILRAKQLGPILKLVICVCFPAPMILWLLFGIFGSIIGGAAYGFLAPMFATLQAVGEEKPDVLFHCICDGIWDTIEGSCTVVRDLGDVCFHSYFSFMGELQCQRPPGGQYYEIRLLYLPGAIIAGILGVLVDVPVISLVALFKSPYMLFKGWHRLFHDCIGQEGPFLETICIPFAGLAILLWPLAVVGAVLGSILSGVFLGAYGAVVVYQESSFWLGLCYVVASLSIYDEYSNDVLDMPEGSCFPRPRYRKKAAGSQTRATSFSRPDSFRNPPSRLGSLKTPMVELKPFELIDGFFEECQRHGEIMVSKGLITLKDIEDAKSNRDGGRVISVGLPAYCLLQVLLRSANAKSVGILLSDGREITSTNRPKDTFFDWFLNPLLIIKDQLKAENLSEAEEDYLGKLILLSGDPKRLLSTNFGSPPESQLKQAELDALARRLQGITKSISRYPTYRRRFDDSIKIIFEELVKKDDSGKSTNGPKTISRSHSMFGRMFSQKSFRSKTDKWSDQEDQPVDERNVEIQ